MPASISTSACNVKLRCSTDAALFATVLIPISVILRRRSLLPKGLVLGLAGLLVACSGGTLEGMAEPVAINDALATLPRLVNFGRYCMAEALPDLPNIKAAQLDLRTLDRGRRPRSSACSPPPSVLARLPTRPNSQIYSLLLLPDFTQR